MELIGKGYVICMVLWRPMRDICLSFPEELLAEVDEAAKDKYMSRSTYIRYVLQKEIGGHYPKTIEQKKKEDPFKFIDLDDS